MKNTKYFLVLAYAAITAAFSYFAKPTDVYFSIAAYASLFAIYFSVLKFFDDKDVQWALYAAIFIRLMLIPSFPNFSSEIWRYVWDGNLQAIGFNPYSLTPKELMDGGLNTFKNSGNLFHLLNSTRETSLFPPLMQGIFYLCAKASLGHFRLAILLMKSVLVISEIISLSVILKLLQKFSLPAKNIFWYAFNPLVMIELSGNAHFEALMLCLLLVAFQYYLDNKTFRATLFLALSIATKIFPIFLLPLILCRNKWKQNLKFTILFSIITWLVFFLYINDNVLRHSYSTALQQYFNQFEFNSFLFYWLNILIPTSLQPTGGAVLSRILVAIPFLFFVYWSWKNRQEPLQNFLPKVVIFWMLFLLSFTVINAWYIAPLVLLVVFVRLQSILLFSAFAMANLVIAQQVENEILKHAINSFFLLIMLFIFFKKDFKLLKS